ARRLLHRLQRSDIDRARGGAELAKAPRAHQHPRFERADRAVEGIDGAREIAAEVEPVAAEVRDALVELGAELADLLGIGGDRLLAPAVRDGAQQPDQVYRRRD